jgi:peptidoglycan/xylan/chitin deacetylase (PgdA/CDA1 family)
MKSATVPLILRLFYPSLIWKMPAGKKQLFLTFDDGPHPEITAEVLRILDQYHAKATFFCVGENVKRYPETYKTLLENGHKTGNHSFNHLKGWKNDTNEYCENVAQAAELISSDLFRPPYGKIKPMQIRKLREEYKIIMWSVLSHDFDKSLHPDDCLKLTMDHVSDGSIIVFHDSEKASERMLYVLPRLLETFSAKGFTFPAIRF